MSFIGNALNNLPFTNTNTVVFTSNGTYTPPQNLLCAHVIVVGGGGGGGATRTTSSSQRSIGQGGAGGATAIKVFLKQDLIPNVSITIGSGGTAPAANSSDPGGPGGSTTFSTSTPLSSTGGGGGSSVLAARPYNGGASGGSASGGDLNIPGGDSGMSMPFATVNEDARMMGDSGLSLLSPSTGTWSGSFPAARTGRLYGGGGGTHSSVPSNFGVAGAEGAQGVVVITEYLAE